MKEEKPKEKKRKDSRNPGGSMIKLQVTRDGKRIFVWDVRKRHPKLDENNQPLRNAAGRIIYQNKTQRCYSYAEACTALGNLPAKIEEEKQEKQAVKEHVHTLTELIDYYETEYVKKAVFSKGKKIIGYRQDTDTIKFYLKIFKEFFGDIKVKDIKYEDLRRFSVHLATTPNKFKELPAPSSTHRRLGVLNRVLNIGVQLEWIVVNPFTKGPSLMKKSDQSERNRMLTHDEEIRLLAACDAEQDIVRKVKGKEIPAHIKSKRQHLRTYILLALDTAMRRGEIWNLRWWQVDFKQHVIYLTEEAAKETKTGVEGILPLTKRLAVELETIKAGREVKPQDLVVGKCDFKRAFKTACTLAKIDNLQFRDLRATAATRMMMAGNVGDIVRKITRHTRTETFLDHYTNIDQINARAVGEKLDEFNEREMERLKKKVA